MYKICSKCKEQKLFSEFNKNKSKNDGYSTQCKNCIQQYYQINKANALLYQKEYYEANKDKILERVRDYQQSNKDARSIYMNEYRESNKGKILALNAKRYTTKLKATPDWLSEIDYKDIEDFYKEAQHLELLTGQKYHVDHIVPLQGKNVCGLHVPWNLQVMPAKENLSKSNKLQEEYYDNTCR
jgi:hypothetical protein